MTTTSSSETLTAAAQRYLWMHFTPMSDDPNAEVPVIVRGEGAWVYDQHGKKYLDGLAGLFVSQVGHGRTELADAAAEQARKLAYFPVWSYAHPGAIELAERLATSRPATSSACSSRPAAARPSSRRGSSRASTSRRSVSPTATR
jgi:adenosylmethionine-8-amino-7-oxononanoate aminotransferase